MRLLKQASAAKFCEIHSLARWRVLPDTLFSQIVPRNCCAMNSKPFNLDFESFQILLLEMAHQREVEDLLRLVTSSLASSPSVALARVWLAAPGDSCDSCIERPACAGSKDCLHLVSSHGFSLDLTTTWNEIAGSAFGRFPFGARKVGRIAQTGQGIIATVHEDHEWISDTGWVNREKIASFVGQPMIHDQKPMGVLAMFTREIPGSKALGLMRMIANHLAYAISNARAFAEIKELKKRIENENSYLREEVRVAQSFKGIIGTSEALRNVLNKIALVASLDTNILITGESGTGKELVAREIHARSGRAEHPMIKINCAAIPKDLFESEFFGHSRGAFTGAHKERLGFFQTAHRGTLFLDEVSEIPLELQGKLLRVLQEKEYQRIGETASRKVDVRIIAATNKVLEEEVAAGRFRQDLYYRINVFPISMPPLRGREEDIPLLIDHFLLLTAKRLNRPLPRLDKKDIERLTRYDWPGNIRELQNVIERIVISNHLGRLDPGTVRKFDADEKGCRFPDVPQGIDQSGPLLTYRQIRKLERKNIILALAVCNGKVSGPGGASELLGLKATTLFSRIKALGITKDERRPASRSCHHPPSRLP